MRASELGLALLVTLTNCGGDWRDDYDFAWQGELVTIYGYGYTDDDVCGGSYVELEQHTTMIAEELGVTVEPFGYRWLSPGRREQLEDDPCGGWPACVNGNDAIAEVLPLMHEAVHMITRNIGTDSCPTLIDEGLAMYYNHAVRLSSAEPLPDPDIVRGLFAGAPFPLERTMPEAMHIVSFMAETYGTQAIVALCEVLPREPSREQWQAAMQEALGVTVEQFLTEYESYPQCTYPQMRAKLWGCRRPPDIMLRDVGQQVVIESSCNDLQATNAGGGPGDAVLRRLVYVPWAMGVAVDVYSPGERRGPKPTYVITECVACSEQPEVFGDQQHLVLGDQHELRPGYHEVTVFFDRRDRVRLSLEVAYVVD